MVLLDYLGQRPVAEGNPSLCSERPAQHQEAEELLSARDRQRLLEPWKLGQWTREPRCRCELGAFDFQAVQARAAALEQPTSSVYSIYSYLPHLLEMWLCKIFEASQACRHIQFGINLRAKHHERRERRLEQIRKPIAGPK